MPPHYPELPLLQHDDSDVVLEVFSHSSLGHPYDPDQPTDNRRLAELGRSTLQFVVTHHLYTTRPILEHDKIPVSKVQLHSVDCE